MADAKVLVRHPSGHPMDIAAADTATAPTFKATSGGFDAGGSRVQNVATPTAASDAATKAYADGIASGIFVKTPARVATTANVTLTAPGASIDGVSLVIDDRVLVKSQTDTKQNGIYLWKGAAAAMVRAADTLSSGAALMVNEGTTLKDTQWVLTSPDTAIVIGTSNIVFTQFRTLADLIAGRSIDITGNTIAVKTGDGIKSTGDIAIDRGNGLTPSGVVAVLPKPSGGLAVDSTGVSAVQGNGIAVGATIAVKLDANPGLVVAAAGLKVGAGNGIDVTGGAVAAKGDAASAISVAAAGIQVKADATKGLGIDASAGLQVKLGSFLSFDGSGRIQGIAPVESVTKVIVPAMSADATQVKGSVMCQGPTGELLVAKNNVAGRGDVVGWALEPYGGMASVFGLQVAGTLEAEPTGLAMGSIGYLGPTGNIITSPPATGRIVRLGFMTALGFVISIMDFGER